MSCSSLVSLHRVHRQGLTRYCHGSSFIVDTFFTFFIFFTLFTFCIFALCTSFARVGNNTERVQVRCAHWMSASYFLVIRLGPKTSECEKNVTVVSPVTGCDVTNCATTSHGFNKKKSKTCKKCQKSWKGSLRYLHMSPITVLSSCSPCLMAKRNSGQHTDSRAKKKNGDYTSSCIVNELAVQALIFGLLHPRNGATHAEQGVTLWG